MAEALSKTLTHGDFDSVFQEVQQPEMVSWTTEGELRLFHLVIRNNKITEAAASVIFCYTRKTDNTLKR